MPALIDKQGELKGEVLGRAYGLMRYDAITLGETDLFYGPSYLANTISKNSLPMVSLNIKAAADSAGSPTKTGMPPCGELNEHPLLGPEREPIPHAPLGGLPPFLIRDAGGAKVAFVGLLNHRVNLPENVTDSLTVAPMEEGLGALLQELGERTDVIVALMHAGTPRRARAIADSFPQFDAIVAGHVEPVPEPYYEDRNGTVVAYVRSHGRFMGRLNLLLDDEHKVIGFGHEMLPVGPELKHDPEVIGLLAEYIDRLKILVASTAFRPKTKDLYIPPANYVTAASCYECHTSQYEQWKNTGHAHAFDTLEEKDRDFDPDCQRCHTTGFRFISGFVTPRGSPHLKHVQCESCHGPGGDHARNPAGPASGSDTAGGGEEPDRYGVITEASCKTCHTPHNSPDFDYEKYLEKVKH